MRENAILGWRLGALPRPSRSFAGGRVCAAARCRTVLSIYNEGRFCAVHQRPERARTFGRLVGTRP